MLGLAPQTQKNPIDFSVIWMESKVFVRDTTVNRKTQFPDFLSCWHDGLGNNLEGNHCPDALALATSSQSWSLP